MEYSTDGGSTWQSGLTRQDYNFFELSSGTGSDTVAIRVESVNGDRVVVKDIAVTGGNSVDGSANY